VPVWVSLLRGINLGSHNKVNMPRLREALADAGFRDVRTYVQSGNVITRSGHRSPDRVADDVRRVVRASFDVDVPVIVRSPGQLRDVLAWCPFPDAADRPKQVHVVHLETAPNDDDVRALTEVDWSPDAVQVRGSEVVIRYADTMHSSRLQSSGLLKTLRTDGTARNWRTLSALVDLTSED
jgi:uncharacterized protein (DUF1697 family)